jgi:hypothetical protein
MRELPKTELHLHELGEAAGAGSVRETLEYFQPAVSATGSAESKTRN